MTETTRRLPGWEDDSLRVMAAIETQARELRHFRGTDQSKLLVGLLNALAESYRLDLADVAPDGLVRVQTALRQVLAIRDVLTSEHPTLPRI
jgi:hypothetical protein